MASPTLPSPSRSIVFAGARRTTVSRAMSVPEQFTSTTRGDPVQAASSEHDQSSIITKDSTDAHHQPDLKHEEPSRVNSLMEGRSSTTGIFQSKYNASHPNVTGDLEEKAGNSKQRAPAAGATSQEESNRNPPYPKTEDKLKEAGRDFQLQSQAAALDISQRPPGRSPYPEIQRDLNQKAKEGSATRSEPFQVESGVAVHSSDNAVPPDKDVQELASAVLVAAGGAKPLDSSGIEVLANSEAQQPSSTVCAEEATKGVSNLEHARNPRHPGLQESLREDAAVSAAREDS